MVYVHNRAFAWRNAPIDVTERSLASNIARNQKEIAVT